LTEAFINKAFKLGIGATVVHPPKQGCNTDKAPEKDGMLRTRLKMMWFKEFAVRLVYFVGQWSVLACAALVSLPVMAQTVATPHSGTKPSGHTPTRMQRCESEVASLSGAERKRVLRECLVSRNEGERIVSRNCSRQFRDMPPGDTKVNKGVFMKQCVQTSLKAGHDKLPARKPVVASSSPSPSGTAAKAADKPVLAQASAAAKPASSAAATSVPKKP
jgi:hypothetical protein